MGNLLVAQSGGPTALINSTLCGILKKAYSSNKIEKIYGAKFGIKGILKNDLINLNNLTDENLDILRKTPGSALGSCRYKLKNFEENEEEYETILSVFKKNKINYFIYIGGNDSMDTVYKLSAYFKNKNINDLFIVGAPKTIDNDLLKTDHCPGFASCAKYIATTMQEIERDCAVYDIKAVTIVETMGRDTGWLTAACALSGLNNMPGPSLIYCCERAFSLENFLKDIENKLKEKPNILVAVSEGVKAKDSKPIFEKTLNKQQDVFGHFNNAGISKFLEEEVKKNFNIKTRSIELNIAQRCSSNTISKVDFEESFLVGEKAVSLSLEEKTAVMATIIRKNSEIYEVCYGETDVLNVANKVKKMPDDFITKEGNYITNKAIQYLKPLILGEVELKYKKGLPLFFRLY